MAKNQPEIYILNRDKFEKAVGKKSSDFKSVPTPAITSTKKKEEEIIINFIAIDEEFLPKDKKDEYFRCLIQHELAEFDFYIQNPEEYKNAVENSKIGKEIDPIAHLHALKEELKFTKELGILDEYNEHWKNWMENKLKEASEEKIIEAIKERIKWREEAFKEVSKESGLESRELKGPLR